MENRPKSGRVKSGRQRDHPPKISSADLRDLAHDPHSLSYLASSYEAATKSAVGFNHACKQTVHDSSKQAWAPIAKQTLASSSSRFQDGPEPHLPPNPNAPPVTAVEAFGRAEDHIYLDHLVQMHQRFEEAERDGDGTLDLEEFVKAFDKLFGLKGKSEEEIWTFFQKIDYNSEGYIDWDKFCTYMYLEFHERDDAHNRATKVEFHSPAVVANGNPHKDSLCRISHLSDGSMVSCSQDGVVCLWNLDLEPKRVKKAELGQTGKAKWVTDMALCIPQGKLLLTTGDHEVQFYEMVNFEPYCQLRRLESVPLKVDFWSDPENQNNCLILVGDKEGAVTVIKIPNIKEAFKYWKLGPKSGGGMPTYTIDRLVTDTVTGTQVYRWRLHTKWVSEVHYFAKLRCFTSCSSDPVSSLVIGSPTGSTPVGALLHTSRQISMLSINPKGGGGGGGGVRPRSSLPAKQRASGDQRVFRIRKGVSTVDYCPKNNVIVTGSLDQVIRIWNPFVTSKPIGLLFGQCSPVFSLTVEPTSNRIYSIGNDNTIKVWDILDHHCLCTVIPSAHKIYTAAEASSPGSPPVFEERTWGRAFHFNPVQQLLALGTEQLAVLKLDTPPGIRPNIVQSHRHPVVGVQYSRCFNQLVTACEGAVVRVWELCSGKCVFEFSTDSDSVSSLAIDHTGKRLVTGARNGAIKLWNYNNGQCIRSLDKGNSEEVTDMKFVSVNLNRYILAVGWDKKISLFADVGAGQIHHIQKPIEAWSTATEYAHTEDILCVAFGAPNLMATASFDGQIIVWGIISCQILTRLKAPPPDTSSPPITAQGDESVQKLLFLNKRSKSRTAATLVASGPAGYIHFWNVYNSSGPMGRFPATRSSHVTALAVDSNNTVLVSGDLHGFISLWSIKAYCTNSHSTQQPNRISLWRAHTHKVTSIEIVEERNVLVTSSSDCAVRLWTLEGQYIGTLGQEKQWWLGDASTYQHPLAPVDVLLDPLSIPEVRCASQLVKDEERESPEQRWQGGGTVLDVENEEEEEENKYVQLESHIKMDVPGKGRMSSGRVGKRLRHLRTHSALCRSSSAVSGVYKTLPYQPLSDEPRFTPPDSLQPCSEQ